MLRNEQHDNIHLQRAWNLYGEDAFAFHVLEEVASDALLAKEQEYLDDYLNQGRCYNIAIVAGPAGPKSEETRRSMSKAHMGHAVSDETKRKISKANKGKKCAPFSEEHKRNISKSLKGHQRNLGHKHTKEAKRNMSEAATRAWANGKPRACSEESRRKMSVSAMRAWAKKREELNI